jgi:hypothetical protein
LNGGQFGQADLGGPVGTPGSGKECNIDGVADGNDNFHALRCFADTDFQGQPMYPCEPSPPSAINVDAGSNGSCVLDGVCDGNDAFHTLRSFSDTNFLGQPGYPCSCAGPAPNGARIQPGEYTGLVVLGPRFARPDEQIDVEVYLDADINILTGFQLHLGASGGLSGHLELVDISVDDERSDSAFTGVADAWSAFNRASAQMVSGVNTMGVTARAGTYLATFTYHVPEDASGTFLVSVLYDDSGTSLDHRTFLFGEYARPIGVESLTPARISVVGQPARGRR